MSIAKRFVSVGSSRAWSHLPLLTGIVLAGACGGRESSAPPAQGDMSSVPGSVPGASVAPTPMGAPGSAASGPDDIIVDVEPAASDPASAGPDAELSEDNACEAVSSQADVILRPIDVIVVIDNSGSMEEEIESVERNINVNFAAILDESGIDYRVLMLSGYRGGGPVQEFDYRVCIEPPLGPSACTGRTPADNPLIGERVVHFDQPIGSTDAPCLMLETLTSRPVTSRGRGGGRAPTRADDPQSQAGWTAHLRPESSKAFIMIGDDTVRCQRGEVEFGNNAAQTAADFDERLRTAAPELFGATPEARRYAWHSIVGVAENTPADAVYEPTAALVNNMCGSAVDSGAPHQELSRLTGGLRYPVCAVASYDAVFRRIATEIVDGANLPCSWEIPAVPEGKIFDKDKVNLAYLPGDGTPAPELGRVDTAADCAAAPAWYYDDITNPTTIHACPSTCETFAQDATGKVDLLFGCETRPPTVK